jgi:hypothetical protein
MKYSELYDAVYRRLWSSEKPTWDAFFDEHASFEQFWTRPFLNYALPQVSFATARPRQSNWDAELGRPVAIWRAEAFL